jgi:6-phosphogluconolactonase
MSADASATPDWRVCSDSAALAAEATKAVASLAKSSIQRRGRFQLALAGGRTPQALYRRLRRLAMDWPVWHVYFGDERCVPVGDPQRNDRMAGNAWLDHVPIPTAQVHPIPAERGARAAALAYSEELRQADGLDLAVLGVGEDGHVASLFPGMNLDESSGAPPALAVFDAPKPPAERVTLSLATLNRAEAIIVLVDGAEKREAMAKWRAGEDVPVSHLAPTQRLTVFLTAAAVPDNLSNHRP